MFKQIKTKTGLLCMSLGLLISLMGGDCGGSKTDCPSTKLKCDGKCIEINTTDNCGACGNKCDAGAACVQDDTKKDGKFMCQALCAAGEGRCDGKCISLLDDKNCGACGTVCTDKQKCGNHNGADTNSCLLADDETCTEGAECFGGACPRKTKKCAEAAGFTCEGSKECASSRCTNQPPETEKKCLASIGATCDVDKNCASGSCLSGNCATVDLGKNCYAGVHCTSGICSGNNFSLGKCQAAIGGGCTADTDCSKGVCSSATDGKCVWNIGDTCTDGEACLTGTCASGACPTLAAAQGCFIGTPAASNSAACGDGVDCTVLTNGPTGSGSSTCGGTCDPASAASCVDGYYCKGTDATDGACTVLLALGDKCTDPKACPTKTCTSGICTGKIENAAVQYERLCVEGQIHVHSKCQSNLCRTWDARCAPCVKRPGTTLEEQGSICPAGHTCNDDKVCVTGN